MKPSGRGLHKLTCLLRRLAAAAWTTGTCTCAGMGTHIQQGDLVCRILVVCRVCGVVVELSAHHDGLVEQADVVEVCTTCKVRPHNNTSSS